MRRQILTLLLASTILWIPPSGRAEDEFRGLIESRPEGKAGTWVIGGRPVVATERTKLEEEHGPLVVGVCAEVEYEGDIVEEIESEEKAKCGK